MNRFGPLIGAAVLVAVAVCAAIPLRRNRDPAVLSVGIDPAMSRVCERSCATQMPYAEADVHSQPGAVAGELTRCPVSGVVFMVGEQSDHVSYHGRDYYTCCGTCAGKLRKSPARFVAG